MKKYKLKEDLMLPFVDDEGGTGFELFPVKKDSLWSLSEGLSTLSGADIRLDLISGESTFSWIEISRERLERSFEEE